MRRSWHKYWAELSAAAVVLLTLAPAAWGQLLSSLFPDGVPGYDAAPGVTVLSRVRSAFEPLGLRAGAFLFAPRLQQSVGYDSNVLSGAAARGAWQVRTQPSLLFGSTWSRHALGGFLSLTDTRYPGMPKQDRTDGTVSVGGAVDVGRDRLTVAVAHVAQHQDRSQLDAVPGDKPMQLTVNDARLSYAMAFGRWTLTPSVDVSSWTFGDTTILGLPASQAFRDRTVIQSGVTLRYEWAPLRNLVLVTRALRQDYRDPSPGQRRLDSTGYQVLGGFDYDDDTVWRYRALVGVESRQFATFRAHTALIAEAEATWSPSGLTTVRGTLTRSIEDAAQEGVAGFTYTSARLTIDHEYMRNVVLSAAVSLQQAQFLDSGATQRLYGGELGIDWWVNRYARLSATYDLTAVRGSRVFGSVASGDYERHLALLTLRLGI